VNGARAVALALACLLLVGCGGDAEEPTAAPATTDAPRERPCLDDREGVSTAFVMWSAGEAGAERPQLSETLDVFARPRSPADTTELFSVFSAPAPPPTEIPEGKRVEDVRPGSVVPERSRLLLTDLGSEGASLYAAPTDNGWVCVVLGPGGGGGCTPQLSAGIQVYMVEHGCAAKKPPAVYGLAANDVDEIRISVGPRQQDAVVAENGFFAELPLGTSADDLDAIVVLRADGRSERIPLPRPQPR
jgi:hypothetical protein